MKIDKEINILFNTFWKFSKTKEAITRLPFSPENEKTVIFLKNYLKKIGKKVYVDDFGNVASYSNNKESKIVFISHYDSVPNGGKYDGIAGIVFGLILLNEIKNSELFNRVELIAFNNEESSKFGRASLGSKYFFKNLEELDFNSLLEKKEKISELMSEYNFSKYSEIEKPIYRPGTNFFEIHIDQTYELIEKKAIIGIVEKIAGHIRMKVDIEGKVDHSGLIDIEKRKNSLISASELVLYCRRLSEYYSEFETVATVTRMFNSPNITNMVPGNTELFIDIRGTNLSKINEIKTEIISKIKDNDSRYKTTSISEIVSQNFPAEMNRNMLVKLNKLFKSNNLSKEIMNSVAWHDIAEVTEFFNTNLIFIQNPSGRSHCPEEEINLTAFKALLEIFIENLGDLIDN